jgi:hypothetical protein
MEQSPEATPHPARARMKRIIPNTVWRRGSEAYWWYRNRGNHQLAAMFSTRLRSDRERLKAFRDRHIGERCFIIGNGPSLKVTDLSLLRNEITFGMNRIYLMFEELGFPTTYFFAINTLVIEQCASEIRALPIPKFITWRSRQWMKEDSGTLFVDTDYRGNESFSVDLAGRVFEGGTVTYVALQAAYWMGFQEVILVGVDHRYSTKGPANATVVSQSEDPNHFHPEYFGRGFRWQLPDLEASERSYRRARDAFEADDRKVVDATVGGLLEVFKKVDYLSLFAGRGVS